MAAYCQVTETGPQFGHHVSHAQNKTKRRFNPNIQKKTYFVPSLKRNVTPVSYTHLTLPTTSRV